MLKKLLGKIIGELNFLKISALALIFIVFPLMGDTNGVYALLVGLTLILVDAIGPDTIKKFIFKIAGLNIEIERHETPPEDKKIIEEITQPNPPKEIQEKAELIIKAAEQRSPDKRSAEDYLALAGKYLRTNQYDKALSNVHFGLQLKPEDNRLRAHLLALKAIVYKHFGLKDFAIKFYEEALQVDPEFFQLYVGLGLLYSEKKEYVITEDLYKKALQIEPKYIQTILVLGDLYLVQSRYAEAEELYKNALEIDSQLAKPHHGLGLLYFEQKKFAQAKRELQKVAELYQQALVDNPNDEEIRESLKEVDKMLKIIAEK